jgi:hypothetical protein
VSLLYCVSSVFYFCICFILLLRGPVFLTSPLDFVYGKQGGVREDLTEDALKEEKNVEKINQIHLQVHETLKKSQEKYKARHDQHKIKRKFRVGDIVWLQLNKERL